MIKSGGENYLRELASEIFEFAGTNENVLRIKRWRDVNALRKPDRLPVYTYPSGAVWREIIPNDSYRCGAGPMRDIEFALRGRLYKMFVGDDTPQQPYYPVEAVFDVEPANTWGVDVSVHEAFSEGGSWAFDPAIMNEGDLEKLKVPVFTYNAVKTMLKLESVAGILGDAMPVKLVCNNLLSANLGYHAAMLRGLQNLLTDVLIEPELLHRIMGYLTESVLNGIDALESTKMVTPNHEGDTTHINYSDPIGEPGADGTYSMRNCWCVASSQEFDPVSPGHWEEFSLNYQKRIFKRYGLISYGCCENLTWKADGVMSIPNLRVFVCSPWSDLDRLIEKTGGRYVIQWRQRASEIIFANDMSTIRRHLRDGLEKLKGLSAHIMLREVETLNGNPELQKQWARVAIEEASAI